jgi:hypothetical protein
MLIVVDYIGRALLCLLIGSWADTAVPRARNFTLAAGSLVLGLVVGLILYEFPCFFLSFKIERLGAFVWLPAGIIVLTFVVEGIRKEIQKNAGQTT